MPDKASGYGKPQLLENRAPPYMVGLFGRGGGYPSFAGGKRAVCPTFSDDRASFRGHKREIWDEIYTELWSEESEYVGKAEICCHEFERAGNVEVESGPYHFLNIKNIVTSPPSSYVDVA